MLNAKGRRAVVGHRLLLLGFSFSLQQLAFSLSDDGRELFGVGRNPLEKLELLQHAAGAFGNGAKRIIGDMHR